MKPVHLLNFLPWSIFLLHIYSKPLKLHYLALLSMHFPLSCTFKMFFRIYLLIYCFYRHAYTPLFCSKVFISMLSAVTVRWHIPVELQNTNECCNIHLYSLLLRNTIP